MKLSIAVVFLLPTIAFGIPVPQGSVIVLHPGEKLEVGTSVLSPNHNFKLAIEHNRMVVYATCDNSPVFSTSGLEATANRLELSTDGNLMLYGRAYRRRGTVWQSGSSMESATNDGGAYKLYFTDEGALEICRTRGDNDQQKECHWRSMKTLVLGCRTNNSTASKVIAEVGSPLVAGSSPDVYSPSRDFRLAMQQDGNVVIYRTCDEAAVFSTYTSPGVIDQLVLSNTGNLEAVGSVGAFWPGLWYSEPWYKSRSYDVFEADKYENSVLRLANNGLLYLCKENDCHWQSEFFNGTECVKQLPSFA